MFPHTLLHYLEFIWDIILSRQELLFPFGHWSWWVNDFFVVKQSMTTSASHCTELRNVLNRPKDLPCQRGTSRLVQRNKICRQDTTALWKIQTCAAHRCTSGLSALTDTHSTSWANGTCVPLQPGWCFCTITVTRLAGSCLRAGQPIFPLASWLLFFCFVLFLSVPNENKFTETFMSPWQGRLDPFQRHSHSANGFFREITFCTELWSSKDAFNEPALSH